MFRLNGFPENSIVSPITITGFFQAGQDVQQMYNLLVICKKNKNGLIMSHAKIDDNFVVLRLCKLNTTYY